MHRGYYKAWRKITDSVSWSRGLEFRGLMHSILVRANRKPIPFRGEMIPAGSFAVVMTAWAEELGITRQKLQRMLKALSGDPDDFITIHNSGNRFSIITVRNWKIYQTDETEERATDEPTTGQPLIQPPGDHRATEQEREEFNIRESFKTRARVDPPEEKSAPPSSPVPPVGEASPEGERQGTRSGPKKTDSPTKARPSRQGFMACWQVYPVKQGQEEAWREWCRLEDNGTLEEPWVIREAIQRMVQEDDRWREGYAPRFAKWLSGKGWTDEPYRKPAPPPSPASNHATGGDMPRCNSEAQRQAQSRSKIAAALNRYKRGKNNVESGQEPDSFDDFGTGRALPGGVR